MAALTPLRNPIKHEALTDHLRRLEQKALSRLRNLEPDDLRINHIRQDIAALRFAIEVIDTTDLEDLKESATEVMNEWGYEPKTAA